MKRTGRVLVGLLIVSACAMAAAPNKAAMTLFQDALYQEQTAGDLDKAIELYQKVVTDAGEIEKLAAKATFQLGMCYLKKDDKEKAAEYFQKVVSNYPAQKELVQQAQGWLNKITPSIADKLPAEIIKYIVEKHFQTGKKAKELGIPSNTHIYGVDGFKKYSGGLLDVYNMGSETWTGKRNIGTFTPNNKNLKLYNEQFQEQVFEWEDVELSQGKRSHLIWTPDHPVKPGEFLVLGYLYNNNPVLPAVSNGYELVMQNNYGSEVFENFFLVLPSYNKIVKASHEITSHQRLLDQLDIYQFERHMKGENNVITVTLDIVDLTTANSPVVVQTLPDNFANNVPPETSEITVTFNQEMSPSGYSWCRNQHPYPDGSGNPRFSNGNFSCSLPVKLKPGQYYRIGINTPPYQSFRNVKGDPARHYVLVFATTDENGQPTKIPPSVIEEANKINFKTLTPDELANIVEEAVATVSTCAETDPRIKDATDSLAGLDSSLVVAEVCKHLDSDKNTIRRAAIYILWKGGLPDITAAEAKLIELCGHEENFTRGMAALTLSNIKTPISFEALKKMTLDADGFARRCAVYALGLYGDPTAIPVVEKALEDQDPLVKDNAQAAMTLLTKQAGSENQAADSKPTITQEMFNDIQSDGTIKFKNPQQVVNTDTEPITEQRFINSDFVQLTKMTDQQGNPVTFTAAHEGNIYRYHVTFDKPILPGETFVYITEGTITGLITPVAGQANTFRYSMTHSPATGEPTLRIEQYLLPAGAEVISTTPADMRRSEKDGRIELKVEKVIPANGSLTTSFKYKLVQ